MRRRRRKRKRRRRRRRRRRGVYFESYTREAIPNEEEEEFITSGNSRGRHKSLSRGAGADQP
jgi:hypothetical protein